MSEYHFLQPLDVLYLRGNRLFADAATSGHAVMPPWPSMAAGALRSQLLAASPNDWDRFGQGQQPAGRLGEVLGTPDEPGTFRLGALLLANAKDGEVIDVYWPLPSDVLAHKDSRQNSQRHVHYLQPQPLPSGMACSAPFTALPLLKTAQPAKPDGGLWLNRQGMAAWLNAQPLTASHLLASNALWQIDPRLGIALNPFSRTTADGLLYAADAVALAENIGFLAGINGADDVLPEHGVLRLGGDGRGASHRKVTFTAPEPDWQAIAQDQRFRAVLTSPGLFEHGWRLPGLSRQADGFIWRTDNFSAHLVTASVSRAETVSGWDLATNRPKPALKAVSTGSVYWFDRFAGDIEALRKLVEQGLSAISPYPDRKRHAEGFNNIMIAAWPR